MRTPQPPNAAVNFSAQACLLRALALWVLLSFLISAPARAADACRDDELEGPYGFLLSGQTAISGAATPVVSLGRIVLDDDGGVSGQASVHFNGLLLGNPVTGAYEVNSDCTMTMSLQDDSGAFQHFSGKVGPGGNQVDIHQTDPGAGARGVMRRTSDTCKAADFHQAYDFTLTGTFTALAAGGASGSISAKGTTDRDAEGHFTLTQTIKQNEGSGAVVAGGAFKVETDCIVLMEITLPPRDGQPELPMKLRGILVNEGKEIIAIQTEPFLTASARFTAR